VPYAELHAHSSFSFLDGASSPAELAEEAERLGLHALAITDHDGFYGIARFAEAAEHLQLKTVFGAELTLGRAGGGAGGRADLGRRRIAEHRAPPGRAPPIRSDRTCSCWPAAKRVSPSRRRDHACPARRR
jgi:hypothetical protein